MIQIKRTQFELISKINSVKDQLRKLNFTQFEGNIQTVTNVFCNDITYHCYPTKQDLLTKQFRSNYIHPWQKRKEILFRKF